jgi:hypothetical protein
MHLVAFQCTPRCGACDLELTLSDITEGSNVEPATATRGIGRTLLNQTSDVPKVGSVTWAPCSCCQGSSAECDKSAEEVLAPSLLQLDVQVVLDFGCLSLAQLPEESVLKYPALDEGRMLQAREPHSQKRFGSAMLNQVCALTLNICEVLTCIALPKNRILFSAFHRFSSEHTWVNPCA